MVYYADYTDYAWMQYDSVKHCTVLSYCTLYTPQMQDWFLYF